MCYVVGSWQLVCWGIAMSDRAERFQWGRGGQEGIAPKGDPGETIPIHPHVYQEKQNTYLGAGE